MGNTQPFKFSMLSTSCICKSEAHTNHNIISDFMDAAKALVVKFV